MGKLILLLSVTLLSAFNILDASTWARSYDVIRDDIAIDAVQLGDGSYLVLFQSNPIENPCCDKDPMIMHLDSEGNVITSVKLAGNHVDYPVGIDVMSNGNIVVVGFMETAVTPTDGWVIVLDQNLSIISEISVGSTFVDRFLSVTSTSDGGAILGGQTFGFGAVGSDMWVLKLDSSGSIQWQRSFRTNEDEDVTGIIETAPGEYVLHGNYSNNDSFIHKLDSNGSTIWARRYSLLAISRAGEIIKTLDGGLLCLGDFSGFGADLLLMKLSNDGIPTWAKTYGGLDNDTIYSSGGFSYSNVLNTDDGGYLFSGTTYSYGLGGGDFWVLKVDSLGAIDWQRSVGGPGSGGIGLDGLNLLIAASDSGYLLGGSTNAFTQVTNDAWLVKIDGSGNLNDSCELSFDTFASPVNQSIAFSDLTFTATNTSAAISDPLFTVENTLMSTDTQCEQFCPTIFLTPSTLPNGHVGQLYDQQLIASGGLGPYDFSLTGGSPPSGISLGSDGLLSGTPTLIESVSFEVTVSDSLGCSTIINLNLTIEDVCLFCDDFNDGILASSWTYSKGIWTESSGFLQSTNNKKSLTIATPVFSGCSSCTIAADVTTAGNTIPGVANQISIFGWYVDKKNSLELIMHEEKDRWILKQRVNGSVVAKTKAIQPILPNTNYHAEISFDGNIFTVSIDGVQVTTLPKGAGTNPSGTIAFQVKATTGSFDSINVN